MIHEGPSKAPSSPIALEVFGLVLFRSQTLLCDNRYITVSDADVGCWIGYRAGLAMRSALQSSVVTSAEWETGPSPWVDCPDPRFPTTLLQVFRLNLPPQFADAIYRSLIVSPRWRARSHR